MSLAVKVLPFNAALHSAGLLRLYGADFAGPAREQRLPLAPVSNTISLLQQLRTASGFVAVSEGLGVVGGVTLYDHPHRKDVCIIANLVVDAHFRRRGIASSLLHEVIRAARQRRLAHLALQVDAANEAAIGLYQSLRFERVGKVRNFQLAPPVIPHFVGAGLLQFRQASKSDSELLSGLMRINLPSLLLLADPNLDDLGDIANWWLGETSGIPVGAFTQLPATAAVEIKLLLSPTASFKAATDFVMAIAHNTVAQGISRLALKQSAHAWLNLRVLKASGFQDISGQVHYLWTF
jgi:GNAT superfamily N-acetyltransferase